MSKPKTKYVAGFYFGVHEDVLVIEKQKPQWMKGKLNAIGGHIEEGENPLDAMVREFEEETGISVESERWDLFCRLSGVDPESPFEVWFFRTDGCLGDASAYSMTNERVLWMPKDRRTNLMVNLPWLLAMAEKSGKHYWPFDVKEKTPWILKKL